jgi:sarcosine oxidase subunit beta
MGTHELAGALWNPTDGYLDGQVLCQVLAEQATDAGVRIVQRTEVVGAESGGGGALRLVTTTGTLDVDVVVNAAGAWADRIGELLGAPVPCVPIREQVCLGRFPRELSYAMPFVMDYVVGDPEPGLWLRDEGHMGFLAGLHSNEPLEPPVADPDAFPRTVDDEFVEDLAGRLLDRFPALPDLGLKAGWTGLYPTSPDGQVMVGPHPAAPAVMVVAGLGGVGIMLAPVLGRVAAEWIVHGKPSVIHDAERLLPARVVAAR